MKKENQITLTGKIYNITTKFVVLNLHGRLILKAFYEDYTEQGMSLVELSKKFKTDIHENTLITYIKKFLNKDLIVLVAERVGPTKRRKYYKITEKGAVFMERNE